MRRMIFDLSPIVSLRFVLEKRPIEGAESDTETAKEDTVNE